MALLSGGVVVVKEGELQLIEAPQAVSLLLPQRAELLLQDLPRARLLASPTRPPLIGGQGRLVARRAV